MAHSEPLVLLSDPVDWPEELITYITRAGYAPLRIEELALAPSLLRKGDVKALFVNARSFGAKDLLALRECREIAPQTAVVVMATEPTLPEFNRALESGATAFLSWPVTLETVRQALRSGETPYEPAPSSSRKRCGS